ncbi:MAG: hypothetical protein ACUVUC_12345 [Thermoguttaceae bacterium]
MKARALVIVWLVGVCWGTAAVPVRANPAEKSPASPLRFRRVYVPEDRIKDWPRGTVRYVPIPRAEFEQLVDAARLPAGFPAGWPAQALASAQYTARLSGDALVDGEAVWQLGQLVQSPALVALDPCGLAIEEAVWTGEEGRPARLAAGQDGKLVLVAERAGRLHAKWSLRGRRDPLGWLEFALELPACPASRLVVDMPEDLAPLVEHGVVIREPGAGEGMSRWRIELGGQNRSKLRLLGAEKLDPIQSRNTVREATTYDFSLAGLDMSVQWTLDVPSVPLGRLALELDPEVELIGATCLGSPIRWSPGPTRGEGAKSRAILEFPEPLRGSSRLLRLAARAPLQTGRRWRLPALRPEGLFWEEGRATLLIPATLVLQDLAILDGRQTATGRLTPPRAGESIEVQYFSPEAGTEVLLGFPDASPQAVSGVRLQLSGVHAAARVAAALRLAQGERFQLEAEVAPMWAVETVETFPSEALGQWDFQPGTSGAGRLTVRLARPLAPSRPIRLVAVGRYLHSPTERPLTAEDLRPLRPLGVRGAGPLLALETAEPYEPQITPAGQLPRVDPETLTPEIRELLGEPLPEGLFDGQRLSDQVRLTLQPRRPRYSGAIRVEAIVADRALVESYRVRCVPESGRVDRLVVRCCPARGGALPWVLVGEPGEPLSVQLKRPDGSGGDRPECETWEIRLPRARSGPFELQAARSSPFTGPMGVSLACLPGAASQQGTLLVGSTGPTLVRVENRRLAAVQDETVAAEQRGPVLGSFRYDPVAELGAGDGQGLVLFPGDPSLSPPAAWVWHCELDSCYGADGSGRHVATYRLENSGCQRLPIALPWPLTGQNVRGIWIDQSPVRWQRAAQAADGRLEVPLPAGRRYPVLSIDFLTEGPPLGIVGWLEPLLPLPEIPMLERTWTVWLPPGYQASWGDLSGVVGSPAMTIGQRLFGPLGRGPGFKPFRPWSVADWGRLVMRDPERSEAALKAQSLLDRLGEVIDSVRQPDFRGDQTGWLPASLRLSWAELLLRSTEGLPWRVLVDRRALDRLGLSPQGPVPTPTGETPGARAAALIEQVGLACLVCGDVAVLTSAQEAALHRTVLMPEDPNTAWQVLPSALAGQLVHATPADDSWLVPLETWAHLPALSRVPWVAGGPVSHGPAGSSVRAVYRLELRDAGPVRLAVFRRRTMEGFGWAGLLAAFAWGVWRGFYRPAGWTLAAGLAAVLALVLPEPFVPAATGPLWGIMLALLYRQALRQMKAGAGHRGPAVSMMPAGAQQPAAPARLLPILVLVGTAAWGRHCSVWAEQPAAEPINPPRTVYDLLIPVDESQKPAGQMYYICEELFGRLQRLGAARSGSPHGWLIRGATYRGRINWQPPEQLTLTELKATFDLEVLDRHARVRIPLSRDAVQLSPQGALLEGRTIKPEWSDGDGFLTFEVPDPGQYRLELSLQPAAGSGAGNGFETRIPRLASARVELIVPADAPDIEVPSAVGVVARGATPPQVMADLGPTDRLSLRWQPAAGRGLAPWGPDVEQLVWLKVQPGSVVLDATWMLTSAGAPVGELLVAADPRLRLLPSETGWGAAAQAESIPGQPQMFRFELDQAAEPRPVRASFLLTEHSGVGRLRLPYLEPFGARTVKRWMAVWVDPRLQYQRWAGGGLQPVAIPAFISAWPEAKSQPLLAYQLATPQPDWGIAIQPAPPSTTVEQTLWLGCGPGGAALLFEAVLETFSGLAFQYRISVPPDVEVEEVSVFEQGTERSSRWTRQPDGTVLVFLGAPSGGRQGLRLRGRWHVAGPGPHPLPLVRVDAQAPKPLTIHVLRQPSVQVRIRSAGQPASGAPQARPDPNAVPLVPIAEVLPPRLKADKASLGRPVRSYQIQRRGRVDATLEVLPNRPKIRGQQATILRQQRGAWSGEVDLALNVAQGVADQFCLEVPSSWIGPFAVEPTASCELAELPDKSGRLLTVRPAKPVEGDCRLRISSPLRFSAGERVGPGKVTLQQAEITRQVLVLPARTDSGPVEWEIRGLAAIPVPDDLAIPPPGRKSFIAYQVGKEPFSALLEPPKHLGVAEVTLADVNLAWRADGTCHGLAIFDVKPAGLGHCLLELPPGFGLVQLRVEGSPAAAWPVQARIWQIPLGPSRLPQRIEVLFAGVLAEAGDSGPREFPAPRLVDLPVEQMLWTIAGPAGFDPVPGQPIGSAERLDQELCRLGAISRTIEGVIGSPLADPEELARWYRRWARRWNRSDQKARQMLWQVEQTEAEQGVRNQLEAIHRRHALIAERLGAADVLVQTAEPGRIEDWLDLWLWNLDRAGSVTRHIVQGNLGQLPLAYRQDRQDRPIWRVLAALGVAAGSAFLARAPGRMALAAAMQRWPHWFGIIAGLVCWLALRPSLLGCLILLSLLASVVFWQARPRAHRGRRVHGLALQPRQPPLAQ